MSMSPPSRGGRWKGSSHSEPEGFALGVAVGGSIRAILGVTAFILLSSAVVYFTSLDERILGWAVNIGSFLILGAASYLTAKKAGSYGLYYGLAIGGLYAVVTFVIGTLLFPPFAGFTVFLRRLGFALIAGASGGVLGVNS